MLIAAPVIVERHLARLSGHCRPGATQVFEVEKRGAHLKQEQPPRAQFTVDETPKV